MEIMTKGSNQQDDRSSRNSGSIHPERIKMLDITRDKPVKVAVRVAVPVRDHPKFNFVGKLLGPKGNSMKRLQEDTMCKMAVLGRGSMKDRKKEEELRASGDPRYAHLAEDLHIEISTFAAPAEAHARIAYALAEVRRFLVPDYHDDIRQEQMWEMQALTSSPTETGEQNSPTNGFIDETLNSTMDCTNIKQNNETMDCSGIATVNGNDQLTNSVAAAAAAVAAAAQASSPSSSSNSSLHQQQTQQHQQHQHQQQQQQQQQQHQQQHMSHLQNSVNGNNNSAVAAAAAAAAANSLNTQTIHPAAVAAALHHQLATAGMGIIKPATGVAAVTGLPSSQATLGIPSEAETSTPLALLDPPGALLHPALRGSLARKRPLLGVPRSSMNPTKRTVMTLLARAKNSQSIHPIRNAGPSVHESLQLLTTPQHLLLPPQPMLDETMTTAVVSVQKESLAQSV